MFGIILFDIKQICKLNYNFKFYFFIAGQTKVYNCCLCGKMLSSFSSLDRHMLVHSGERPFSCEVCAQTFTTNGNMHRHRRTHNVRDSTESDGSAGSGGKRARKRKAVNQAAPPTGSEPAAPSPLPAKPMVAPPATDKYSPLKCPICLERFYSDLSLEVHVMNQHPGREIKCEDCGHPCPSYNYFKLHRNMFHFKQMNGFTAPPLHPAGVHPRPARGRHRPKLTHIIPRDKATIQNIQRSIQIVALIQARMAPRPPSPPAPPPAPRVDPPYKPLLKKWMT